MPAEPRAYSRRETTPPWPCSRSYRWLERTGSPPPGARTVIGNSTQCAAPDWPRATAQISRAALRRSWLGHTSRCGSLLDVEFPLPFGGPVQQPRSMRFETHAIERRLIRRGLRLRPHFNTIDRAGRQAELAARAALCQNGVHVLGGTDDGVHRAGRETACAADAAGFIDPRDPRRGFHPMDRIQGLHGPTRECGQGRNGCAAARGALIDLRLAARDCRGIRLTSGITATRALSLRQQGVDSRHDVGRGFGIHYLIRMPGAAPVSGDSTKISLPPGPAANIIPSERPNRILRGSKLATTTISRPTSDSGSYAARMPAKTLRVPSSPTSRASFRSLSAPATRSASRTFATRRSTRKKSSMEIELPSTAAALASIAVSDAPAVCEAMRAVPAATTAAGTAAGAGSSSVSNSASSCFGSTRVIRCRYGLIRAGSTSTSLQAKGRSIPNNSRATRSARLGSTGAMSTLRSLNPCSAREQTSWSSARFAVSLARTHGWCASKSWLIRSAWAMISRIALPKSRVS